MKKKVFGYRPSQLKREQREVKSKQLDAFWDKARAMGTAAVPCLREMLQAEKDDGFFLFDASSLLLSIDQSSPTLEAVAGALRYADLKEVDPAAYIRLLIWLSWKDVDIGPLAEKYLTYPDVDTYLPQHAMKLDRISGTVLLYGSMPTALADRYLIAALSFKEPYARSTAFYVLVLSMTEESFKNLQSHANLVADLPSELQHEIKQIRTYSPVKVPQTTQFTRQKVLLRLHSVIRGASENIDEDNPPWVAGVEGFQDGAIATLTEEDIPVLRQARRRSITGVSDEALYEYFALTKILLGLVNRYELYKQFRIH